MRLKILRTPPIVSIDGIQIDCFRVGEVYDIEQRLAEIFLAEGWAEPAEDTAQPKAAPVVRFPPQRHDVAADTFRIRPKDRRER